MILVAGLAIAGVVGIAAAFYFSIRSGGGKRLRPAGAGRAGANRRPGSRSGNIARPDRTDNARRAANGRRPADTSRAVNAPSRNYRAEASTGPNPVLDFGDPALVGGRRAGPGASAGDAQATDPRLAAAGLGESGLGESRLGSRSAARLPRGDHAAEIGAGRGGRPRRRVGFRKGADVDEELWPAESFGGVSDEQFWDDLASDKPLTTTARTAQQNPGARNRPFDTLPPTATAPAAKPLTAKPLTAKPPTAKPPTAKPPTAKPPTAKPPTAKPPTAKPPTAKPPTATQPVQSMTSQVPGATQPVRAVGGPGPLTSAPSQPVSAPSQPVSAPSQPVSAPSQPVSAAAQPAETRRRRRAGRSDDEDPLTSAAFALRSSGPVDGRSSRRSRDMSRDQYDTTVAQETQTFSAAEIEAASAGYPGGVPPFRQSELSAGGRSPSSYSGTTYGDPSSVTPAMNTPPYGENYGYGSGASPAQPDDPRRQNGTRSHARHGGTGEATRATRQTYPQDGYQGTGSYPAGGYQGTGSYQSTGSYQAHGYPTGGYPDGGHQGNGHPAGAYQAGVYQAGVYQASVYQGSAYQGSAYQGSAYQGSAGPHRGNGHRAPNDPREDYR